MLFNDRGDIVIYDAATGARRQITKTSGGEGSPRWARNDTHVTYVSGGNLFIMPVDGSGTARDPADRRHAAPQRSAAHREPAVHQERRAEADRQRSAKRPSSARSAKTKRRSDRLPQFELAGPQQSAVDLMLSPDETHVFIARRRASRGREEHHRPQLRDRERLCRGHSRPHQRRRHAGPPPARDPESEDRQDRPGRTAVSRRRSRPPRSRPPPARPRPTASPDAPPNARSAGRCRSFRRTASSSSRAPARPTTRTAGSSRSIPRPASPRSSTRCTTRRGSARSGSADRVSSSCPTTSASGSSPSATAGCTSTPSTSAPTAPEREQLTEGKWEIASAELAADGKKFYITSTENHPGERHLYTVLDRGRRAHQDHLDDRLERRDRLARPVDAWPGVFLQHQAARGLHHAEQARARRHGRSRRRRPRSGGRSSGSTRR